MPRDRFVDAVRHVIEAGEYPSGARVNRQLGRSGRYLAPIECQWRREAAAAAGTQLHGANLGDPPGRLRPRPVMRDPRPPA